MNAQSQQGEDPNMHRDLSREFDQQHSELPTPSATDVQQKSAPTPKTRANQYPHNRKALADSRLHSQRFPIPNRGKRIRTGRSSSLVSI